MGIEERLRTGLNPNYQKGRCVIGWLMFWLFAPPLLWLTLLLADETSIKCSIKDLYIDDLQSSSSSNFSNSNQSVIYFNLYLKNSEDQMAIHYDNLNLTFSYYNASTAGGIVPVGNYTIHAFHQGFNKHTERKDYAVMNRGVSWQEISKNVSSLSPGVVFRVDLAGSMKFSGLLPEVRGKRLRIMAWAKVEVDLATGKKIHKKPIKLKHMFIHHANGWVIFAGITLVLIFLLSPCWCFVLLGCICECYDGDGQR